MTGLIHIKNECPPVVSHINERLGKMRIDNPSMLPDFSTAESVFSVSDYSGENNQGYFQALSYVIFDWNAAGLWELARRALRYTKLDFNRSIEFKKMNQDRERQRIFTEFLDTFDQLNGLSLTYLIHRDIRYLFSEKSPHSALEQEGFGIWKPHIAEKMLRIIHLQAPVVAALTNQNHKFLWLTDRDAITKNTDSLRKLTQSVFNVYFDHGFKTFGFAEPFENPDRLIDDLLAIPDLVAGSILEYINASEEHRIYGKEFLVQSKTDKILKWFAKTESKLKKIVCVIRPAESPRSFNVSFIKFNPTGE